MTLFDFKLKKVIYSNTMFKYYSDDKIRNLEYTESKNNFSRFVEKETSIRNIDFEEIFLIILLEITIQEIKQFQIF